MFPFKIENVKYCYVAEMKESLMVVDFSIWSLEFLWNEDPSKKEYGDGAL